MLYGFFIIFLFYAIGNFCSWLIQGIVPGNVIGMVLLFIALQLKWVDALKLRTVAVGITTHMSLFFVPVGVGLMISMQYIGQYWAPIVVSVIISTILVLISTAYVQQKMESWNE
ncbi:holin-like protein [Breznakibacter xylanolyticus]|uniref:Holin-like protein n=1 Tax=Breznakibacter xylanolyticus TaxID=990 RepID=A0A2W7N7P3_9BACT|nr:CidA/LrgA family protein [Breznakibacter xylanolyticus]MBN2742570.1 CidA/LrgA family protein [Marinilabiliaceae bacterium]PZX16088.1 holin-like protein [Breznakibacter xylanolyticus]